MKDVKGEEELYWHDNDIVDHSSIHHILNYYTYGVILKKDRFYGVIVHAMDSSSSGMSEYKREDVGLVCIDGFKDGKTEEHGFHNSDEVSWTHDVTYYLERKE